MSLFFFILKQMNLTFFDIKMAQKFLLFECQILTFFHSILNVLMDSESVKSATISKAMIQNFTLLKSDTLHPNAFRFQKSHTTAFLSIIKKDGI